MDYLIFIVPCSGFYFCLCLKVEKNYTLITVKEAHHCSSLILAQMLLQVYLDYSYGNSHPIISEYITGLSLMFTPYFHFAPYIVPFYYPYDPKTCIEHKK